MGGRCFMGKHQPWSVRKWTDAQKRRAVRALEAGVPEKEVAGMMEASPETLRRWRREMKR